jgi:CDP-glycerol glycerophosphotransferase
MEKQMHGFRARLDYVLKHNYAVNRLFTWSVSTLMKIWGSFISVDEKLVVFSAHSRKYNDSPRTLYENMIKDPKYKDYRFVWALEDPDHVQIPGPASKVKSDTLEYFKTTLKAKYWITCVNIERSLHYKKRSCRYLNTWHGTPYKYIGNDVGNRKDFDFSNVDFWCYASQYEKEIFMRAFNVREDALIPTGMPRNDDLYNVTNEEIICIKKRMGLPLDKKIILYAPTWRDSTDHGATYAIKPPINTKYWEAQLKDEYIVLFRTHGYTNKLLGVEFNDVIRDYSAYPSINDLLKVSDILISDYSATMTDYSILERPVLCFAYDYEQYKSERGLYIDFDKGMPSGVLKTEDEVLDHIKNLDYEKECRKTKEMIKNRISYYGGHATEKCLELLFEK